jgi:hypothetical protein
VLVGRLAAREREEKKRWKELGLEETGPGAAHAGKRREGGWRWAGRDWAAWRGEGREGRERAGPRGLAFLSSFLFLFYTQTIQTNLFEFN